MSISINATAVTTMQPSLPTIRQPRKARANRAELSCFDIWTDATSPAPVRNSPSLDAHPADRGSIDHRRPRVSTLLAEKGLAPCKPRLRSVDSDESKEHRRQATDIPPDETIPSGRRPRLESEMKPKEQPPIIKNAQPPANPFAVAPKRHPLQKSSRPLQTSTFADDVVGKGKGKENIPPGMSMKKANESRTTAAPSQATKSVTTRARPAIQHKHKHVPTVTTKYPAVIPAVVRKPASSNGSNCLSRRTKTNGPIQGKTRLQSLDCKRKPAPFVSCKQLPSRASTSCRPASRRHPVEKDPRNSSVSKQSQNLSSVEKYPVLREDLDNTELYEDNWITHQEASITQLVNTLFDHTRFSSVNQGREEAALRDRLLAIYKDPAIARLHNRLQASFLYGALSIPKDLLGKNLHPKDDVGLRQRYLDLFVETYDLSLLKTAAEVVVGRECLDSSSPSPSARVSNGDQAQQRAKKRAIKDFLETFLIRNEDAIQTRPAPGSAAGVAKSHDTEYEFGSPAWYWGRTTLRSLMLILLLDLAKIKDATGLLLFQIRTPYKSSKAVLQGLASMLSPSYADLSRPLGRLNYSLDHVQSPLQEYPSHVKSLKTDLRDGVLLTRLVEFLLYRQSIPAGQNHSTVAPTTDDASIGRANAKDKDHRSLSQRLKLPCLGRAEKLHNVQIALKALDGAGSIAGEARKGIVADDIVDGHREKTIGLLWGLVGHLGLEAFVDWTELERETRHHRDRSPSGDQADTKDERKQAALHGLGRHTALLHGWADSIARRRGLGGVANLTSSFADGRVLEAIVDQYLPCFATRAAAVPDGVGLPAKLASIGCSSSFVSIFAPAPGSGSASSQLIPSTDFTVMSLAFLASRLLPVGRVHRAVVTLQAWYRARLARRELSRRVTLMRLASHCAIVIQTRDRVVGAAVVLQRAWRAVLDARITRLVKHVTALQTVARGWIVRKNMPKRSKGKGRQAKRCARIRGGW